MKQWQDHCGHQVWVWDPGYVLTPVMGQTWNQHIYWSICWNCICNQKEKGHFSLPEGPCGSLPFWNSGILRAHVFVLISPCLHLLPVSTMQEHFVCLRLVERTAHPSICWMHSEDGWTTHPPALPSALLEHAWNIFSYLINLVYVVT